MMLITDDVLFEKMSGVSGALGVITLNRPKALNALTYPMIQAITEQLDRWSTDDDVKAILIESNHPKAFCAGGDLLYVYQSRQNGEKVDELFKIEYQLNETIYAYPKPYIAFLNGITMGGGVGISVHGSHRVGTEKLLFAMPETGIGFFPDVGGSYFLSRCEKQMGVYLGLTGSRLNVANTVAVGLVDYYIPSEQLHQAKQALLTTQSDFGHKAVVDEILQNYAAPIPTADVLSYADSIEEIFSMTDVEEIFARLRAKHDDFSCEVLHSLAAKSPTSLKVTRKQLQRGVSQSMHDCMEMEYILAKKFLHLHDFFEGIRAIIVDKDQAPHWDPQTLEDVSDEWVEAFFTAR